MVSKLDMNQFSTTWKTVFNLEARISAFLSVINILVSSAKRMRVEILSIAKGRLFIYIGNNIGPRTEP
jgi:hypothetical protein